MDETSTHDGEELPLSKAAQLLLEECRMVLPGIQALFGFQLIAVFNPRFFQLLSPAEQRLHLLVIGRVTLAVALIMAPAAYRWQTGPHRITHRFIWICTRLVLWSMLPLAVSLCIEFYLISSMIMGSHLASLLAAAQCSVFFFLWFVLPRLGQTKGTGSNENVWGTRRRIAMGRFGRSFPSGGAGFSLWI